MWSGSVTDGSVFKSTVSLHLQASRRRIWIYSLNWKKDGSQNLSVESNACKWSASCQAESTQVSRALGSPICDCVGPGVVKLGRWGSMKKAWCSQEILVLQIKEIKSTVFLQIFSPALSCQFFTSNTYYLSTSSSNATWLFELFMVLCPKSSHALTLQITMRMATSLFSLQVCQKQYKCLWKNLLFSFRNHLLCWLQRNLSNNFLYVYKRVANCICLSFIY